ncbi:hypothetical protein F5J12DRAFT_840735 [Pisolithus orientalis]|uniref:uncharacterized protein n=1 Tax=Pisolithus orientalis TaxID=936130 RepID=UPI002224E5E5|nr:uncharacterized protein F5J12DRAFT_840735 [Pisolithus orientalis]KAI6002383.1 hypothetical protein F5J12DRAFT_840735 [Pisolithus orientalis]
MTGGTLPYLGLEFHSGYVKQTQLMKMKRLIPVDDRLDPGEKRTSQRTELLAAPHGLKNVCDEDESYLADRRRNRSSHSQRPETIITTNSEYMVKGMTEWLPTWKVRTLWHVHCHSHCR